MEYIAIRENCKWQDYKDQIGQQKGESFGASIPVPEFRECFYPWTNP
jgi:hypothetical protein